jgi:hypothetical protein
MDSQIENNRHPYLKCNTVYHEENEQAYELNNTLIPTHLPKP